MAFGPLLTDAQWAKIVPHLPSLPRRKDGRALRRYLRRWKIERLFAWLGHYRRLVIRYEYLPAMYGAFFHVACAMIVLRHL